MTIALGMLCGDGIVLGTDTQYTSYGLKFAGQKLFTIKPSNDVTLCIAGAGSVAFMKMTVEDLEERLRDSLATKPATIDLVRTAIKDTLLEIFDRHIYPIPSGQPEIGLLIGGWIKGEGLAFWGNEQTAIHTIRGHTCIGSGAYLAQYLMNELGNEWPKSQNARLVAIHTIQTVKEYVEFCGKGTAVQILHLDGTVEKVEEAEIKSAEAYFEHIPILTGYLLTNPDMENEETLDMIVDLIKQVLIQFQKAQRDHRERQQKIQKLLEARRLKKDAGSLP